MQPCPVPVLSVVVPMYNEESVLPLFMRRLRPALDDLDVTYEVLAVDDGSTDDTGALLSLMRHAWPQLRVVRLRRNRGHQAALTAGLHRAFGEYVASIDADLQDPPEKIGEMLHLARADGLDIVYGVRVDRGSDSILKRWTAGLYYRLMRRLAGAEVPNHAGDFRLISRAAVDALKALPEHQPVYRLLVPWIGFPSGEVPYRRDHRAAGRTKYPVSRMVRLAFDSITNFSSAPLRIASWLGGIAVAVCMLLILMSVAAYAWGRTVPGWTSLFAATLLIGGTQLLCLGLLGEYIGRIYAAVQARPAYFVGSDSAYEDPAYEDPAYEDPANEDPAYDDPAVEDRVTEGDAGPRTRADFARVGR
jgi:polyisoprenyl-phosphate glycosyltransferase